VKRILQLDRNCAAIAPSTRSGLFVDGHAYYRAFYQAALHAEKQILMMGWQFDSAVPLVRGDDAPAEGAPAALLPFLQWLCARKPDLQIHILAWSHSIVFALEREWGQEGIFNAECDQIHFRFDDKLKAGASLHQKLVVVDGRLAFAGGMDICDARWDDREHRAKNPLRINLSGDPVGPYHDVQMFYEGPIAERLGALFRERWLFVTKEAIDVLRAEKETEVAIEASLKIETDGVAVARTLRRVDGEVDPPAYEIQALYIDAIDSAESLVYIETQYLTSIAICEALARRMCDPERSKLQLVVILPKRAEAKKEEVALGVKQTERLLSLAQTAKQTDHALGVYYTVAGDADEEVAVYIHSKLLIVDDRFMTVGSANCTNRSLSLDHELNLAWESSSPGDLVSASIRAARVSLLSEHCGEGGGGDLELGDFDGLVERLDEHAAERRGRLRVHPLESTSIGPNDLLRIIAEQDWGLDPDLVEDAIPARS
jgi:phospholipase D1/2